MAATQAEKAYCVLELAKTNSVTVVQHHFRTKYGKPPPKRQSIYDWYKRFENSGCVCKKKSTGRHPPQKNNFILIVMFLYKFQENRQDQQV